MQEVTKFSEELQGINP